MRIRRNTSRSSDRRGVAAVEFAVFAPVFAILIVGSMSAAKALHASSVMAQALREGARLAAMDWNSIPGGAASANVKVAQDIRSFLNAAGVDSTNVQITISHAEGSKKGQTFTLGDPANDLELFEIKAYLPHSDANVWCSYLTAGKGLTTKVVFRAGHSAGT